MPLIPYEPFRQLDQFRREWDRFFPADMPLRQWFGLSPDVPGIDVYETESEVVAVCDLPGLEKKDDVQIDVDGRMLTISGTIQRTYETEKDRMHRQERFAGRFQRSVSLPANVNADGVRATYKNGVLEIRMPKLKAEGRRRIDIEFH
jgi:HSP20 family protein